MNTSELHIALHLDSCTRHHVGDVCAADQLPSSAISNLPKIFIVNTDPHQLPGKHWVCFYIPHDGPIEFFDSLGKHPSFYSKLFEKFIYSHSTEFIYNSNPLQSNFSDTCGHFCLFYSIHRCRGMRMDTIIEKFSTSKILNDRLVQDFVKKHFNSLCIEGFRKDTCQDCFSPQYCNMLLM